MLEIACLVIVNILQGPCKNVRTFLILQDTIYFALLFKSPKIIRNIIANVFKFFYKNYGRY
jgi:hypothetical protein